MRTKQVETFGPIVTPGPGAYDFPWYDSSPGGFGFMADGNETLLSSEKSVSRQGATVLRPAYPWTPSVQALLRHLERVGFAGAPRVLGIQADGREALSYIEGEFVHPYPWSDEAVAAVGQMLRRLHDATATFIPAGDAVWQPWFLRTLGGPRRVIGHGDVAPWNMVTQAGMPVALVDWEYAPSDPRPRTERA
jgi:hypothetical protein